MQVAGDAAEHVEDHKKGKLFLWHRCPAFDCFTELAPSVISPFAWVVAGKCKTPTSRYHRFISFENNRLTRDFI